MISVDSLAQEAGYGGAGAASASSVVPSGIPKGEFAGDNDRAQLSRLLLKIPKDVFQQDERAIMTEPAISAE